MAGSLRNYALLGCGQGVPHCEKAPEDRQCVQGNPAPDGLPRLRRISIAPNALQHLLVCQGSRGSLLCLRGLPSSCLSSRPRKDRRPSPLRSLRHSPPGSSRPPRGSLCLPLPRMRSNASPLFSRSKFFFEEVQFFILFLQFFLKVLKLLFCWGVRISFYAVKNKLRGSKKC